MIKHFSAAPTSCFKWLACVPVVAAIPLSSWAQSNGSENTEEESLEHQEVVIFGKSEEDELIESAKAVDVVDIKADQNLTADMGEILARVQGVGVRRSGGLGSRARFSLNGFSDDQVRFFIDGIPLDMSSYTFDISNIPVNLVERVDIYHGVVPIKFGADALGGAVNLITDNNVEGTSGSASVQYGDFNTFRSTLNLTHLDEDSGLFARLNAFADGSDNDYEVDVQVPNEVGRPEPARVKRFHDTYSGKGASLDLGIVDQSWADRLQISLYTSEYSKDIQHSANMRVAYGEATVDRESRGINMRYQHQLTDTLELEAAIGHSEIDTHFIDIADFSYNWLGERIVTGTPSPGEIDDATNRLAWDERQFARINLGWQIGAGHLLNFSYAPTWNDRTGKEQLLAEGDRDPLRALRDLYSVVAGIEHTMDLLDDRLQNILFAKHYRQEIRSEQPGYASKVFVRSDRAISNHGWGNATRYKFTDWLFGKFSYEYATRLPRAEEIFGDAVLIIENLDLEEETSHNYNLSLTVDGLESDFGYWRAGTNYFIRDAENLIVLLGSGDKLYYANVLGAESKGIQAAVGWTSPEGFIDIDMNFTTFDLTNTSDDGLFAKYKGDKIPNRPYQFFNSTVGLNWTSVLADYDKVKLNWNARFVDEFYLIWESVGLEQFKETVPSQTSHSLALTYTRDIDRYTFNVSAEVQNLTDEKLFDYYGVQRPGRAFYVKTTVDF
ncbi:tonB family protein [Oleiphilus messinensis]|uniref:TonB family protein n=1 Tax=Oleiphilus messinensis TaxID=141451 RepID=A0A1Y0IGR2_9GAMM|nr:TonB-dependent receptor plug domain-containing protein [Oleiphilus messinensis]ARU59490.1 tonB family protein [Oleiphilus messinensis]